MIRSVSIYFLLTYPYSVFYQPLLHLPTLCKYKQIVEKIINKLGQKDYNSVEIILKAFFFWFLKNKFGARRFGDIMSFFK